MAKKKKSSKKGGNSTGEVILDLVQNLDPEDIRKGIETAGSIVKGIAGIFKKKKESPAEEEKDVAPQESSAE